MAPLDDYILNSADLRWHRLVEKQPDLAPAIDLQRIILTRTLELSNEAPDVLKRSVTAPPGLLDRLASREVPVLNLAVEFQIDFFNVATPRVLLLFSIAPTFIHFSPLLSML